MYSCHCRCNKVLLGGKNLQNFARFSRFKTSFEIMLKILMEKVLEIKKLRLGRFLSSGPFYLPPLPPFPSRVGRPLSPRQPKSAERPPSRPLQLARRPRSHCRVGLTEPRAEPPPDRLPFSHLRPPACPINAAAAAVSIGAAPLISPPERQTVACACSSPPFPPHQFCETAA